MKTLQQLISDARRGDASAYDVIVARFKDNALARAYAILGDRHLAEDAVQEAFTEAFLNLEKLREPTAFPGWFKRIVIKRIDRLIRGKRLDTFSIDTAGEALAAEEPAAGAGIDEETLRTVLARALESLPAHERETARLYYFAAQSQKDIADRLGVPVGTIKKRLFTSRRRLREHLADLDEHADESALPLEAQAFAAAWNGFTGRLQTLIDADPALLVVQNSDGLSLLLYAAHASHHSGITAAADYLVARGARVDIQSAAAMNMQPLAAAFLRAKPALINHRGPWDRTPLHWAASGGHAGLADWLLSQGAGLNLPDRWGCTPLHLAAELGHGDTVRLLLERGADTAATLMNGKTPLHMAAQNGHFQVVELLLARDAVIDIYAATGLGERNLVQRMLSRDPLLIKTRLRFGATPLSIAAETGQRAMAELLVEHGAQVDLVAAVDLGWTDEALRLISGNAKAINLRSGSFGFTALHSATARGRDDLARLLLANGAQVNATDRMYRKTPLGEALYFGNESMAKLLFQHGGTAT